MAQARQAKYITIDKFRGVDFSNDDMAVNMARSPLAKNIISDVAGRPEIRPGIAKIEIRRENAISIGSKKIIAIAKHDNYLIIVRADGIFACLRQTGADSLRKYEVAYEYQKSFSDAAIFRMRDLTYIVGGGTYVFFRSSLPIDVENATEEEFPFGFFDVAGYVPTTTINRTPDGGGVVYEPINLITGRRRNSFAADGTTVRYWLDGRVNTYGEAPKATVDAKEVELKDYGNAMRQIGGEGGFVVVTSSGFVEFASAPGKGEGVDNVVVEFSAEVKASERKKITKCTLASTYGVGNDSRVFLSGNSDYPNTDFYSGLYDPTYFPDTGFTQVGDDSPIYGYLKNDGCQVIVKKADDGESNIFLRKASLQETLSLDGKNTETSTVFSVSEGLSGIGLVSKNATLHINGDPMMLTPQGVYGLETNSITNQRSVQLRSFYINRRLCSQNLEGAKMCAWERYIVIAIDNQIYIGDTQQTNDNPAGYMGYEWYYWELPQELKVTAVNSINSEIIFGTDIGLYTLKQPSEGMAMFSDEVDSTAKTGIDAIWSTPILYGGDFMRYKTISKRGCGILAKPFSRGSGEIFLTTDKSLNKGAGMFTTDIFDWNDIDFNRFTFNMREEPRVKVYPKKHRKVLFFQMAVRHTALDEGFGIAAMRIAYTLGSLTKRGN